MKPGDSQQSLLPDSPFAKFRGDLKLGQASIDCYVLDSGERVISLRAVLKSIADVDTSKLEDYIGVQSLGQYIDKRSILTDLIEFNIPGISWRGKGMKAESFIEICQGYVSALSSGALSTEKQKEIAIRCSILLSSCAKVGLISLIDEATGYQYEREQNALQLKLKAYIAEELRDWEKTFPDELWEEFGRLSNWQGPLHSRPKYWGKLVLELIYKALDPDIAEHLKNNKPPPRSGRNYHQWLTSDLGLKALIPHIHQVIGIAKTCSTMKELKQRVGHHFLREPIQIPLYLPAPYIHQGATRSHRF